LPRFAEVARILTGNPSAKAADGVEWVRALCTELKIPPLQVAGLTVAECSRIIPTAQRASSTQGNPVKLSDEELLGVLENAI
jgi:alcohol dehydrogenase class IV